MQGVLSRVFPLYVSFLHMDKKILHLGDIFLFYCYVNKLIKTATNISDSYQESYNFDNCPICELEVQEKGNFSFLFDFKSHILNSFFRELRNNSQHKIQRGLP